MAKYVIHKKGFFYTDEYFSSLEIKGKVLGSFQDLESAKQAKMEADIGSVQKMAGKSIDDFIFQHPNKKTIIASLLNRFPEHFSEAVAIYYWTFPSYLSKEEAADLLHILEISFHDVVEYEEDDIPKSEITNAMGPEIQEF